MVVIFFLILAFNLVHFKSIACSKEFNKIEQSGLAKFGIGIYEAWGLAAKAECNFKIVHPKSSEKLSEMIEDLPTKIALDNLGFYAYGTAKKRVKFNFKNLICEFRRDFKYERVLLQNLIHENRDSNLLIMYYAKVWYQLGLKAR